MEILKNTILLYGAKREKEMVDVFTSKFVIEAYVNGVELSELTIISNNIMKGLFLEGVIDYNKLQCLSTAILTVDKLGDGLDKNNTLYVPSEKLSFRPDLPGYGLFEFDERRVLTMKGKNKATWKYNSAYDVATRKNWKIDEDFQTFLAETFDLRKSGKLTLIENYKFDIL